VCGIVRNRLFHEQMFPALQEFEPDLEVRARRRGDRSGVHLPRKFFERGRRGDSKLGRVLLRHGAIGVVNRCELSRRELRVKPRVIFSDVANADHANARLVHR
jgi:hypothetical protein